MNYLAYRVTEAALIGEGYFYTWCLIDQLHIARAYGPPRDKGSVKIYTTKAEFARRPFFFTGVIIPAELGFIFSVTCCRYPYPRSFCLERFLGASLASPELE